MNYQREQEKRAEFKMILFELAESQTLFQDASTLNRFISRLEHLYCVPNEAKRFRHFYSDIFAALVDIQRDEKRDINVLGQNLEYILEKYPSDNGNQYARQENISDELHKLYDHVSLDIARITYGERGDYELSQEENIQGIQASVQEAQVAINHQQKAIDNQKSIIEDQKNQLRDLSKQLKDSEREYIAILGIFSAVVLAFIGEIAFSTAVLENIHKSSIYRIVLIVLLIGFVVISTMQILFSCIYKLTATEDKKTMGMYKVPHAIILILIFITIIAWLTGCVERRDAYINHAIGSVAYTESIVE